MLNNFVAQIRINLTIKSIGIDTLEQCLID